jgi:RHS repeat-associated protein
VVFGLKDPLGSTVATTGANGTLTASLDYEPYGEATGSGPASYPFAYTGRVPVTGNIVYYRNRFYDAATGRFLSEDPAGLGPDYNLYRYVGGSPVNRRDPSGEGGAPTGTIYTSQYGGGGLGITTVQLGNCMCQQYMSTGAGSTVPVGKPYTCPQ